MLTFAVDYNTLYRGEMHRTLVPCLEAFVMKKNIKTDTLIKELEKDATPNIRKAEILMAIIDIELEEHQDKADMDLIEECLDFLGFLNNSEESDRKTPENHLLRIYQKAQNKTAHAENSISETE